MNKFDIIYSVPSKITRYPEYNAQKCTKFITDKSFEFEKALMQEHFNENYLESDKYPNAMFRGKVTNVADINFGSNGTYDAKVEGELTIHGVTKEIDEEGTFTVSEGKIQGQSVFFVLLEDYEIKVPGAVKKQISESIEVTVDIMLEEVVKP